MEQYDAFLLAANIEAWMWLVNGLDWKQSHPTTDHRSFWKIRDLMLIILLRNVPNLAPFHWLLSDLSSFWLDRSILRILRLLVIYSCSLIFNSSGSALSWKLYEKRFIIHSAIISFLIGQVSWEDERAKSYQTMMLIMFSSSRCQAKCLQIPLTILNPELLLVPFLSRYRESHDCSVYWHRQNTWK